MRARRRTAAAVAVLTAAVAGGCGVTQSGPISFGPAPRASVSTVTVYLVRGDQPTPVPRQVGSGLEVNVGQAALDLLTSEVLPAERSAGLASRLPEGLRLRFDLTSDDPARGTVVYVGLIPPPSNPRMSVTDLSRAAVDQVTCTAAAATAWYGQADAKIIIVDRQGAQRDTRGCPPLPAPS